MLSDAENYRLGHGKLPEWQRKIPHATVVALAHALCAVSWSRFRDRRTRKNIAAGGHVVGCDSSARHAGLSRCAGALSRAGVPRVMRGKPAPPACEVRAFSSRPSPGRQRCARVFTRCTTTAVLHIRPTARMRVGRRAAATGLAARPARNAHTPRDRTCCLAANRK